jgi:hypothetical protein
MIWYVLPDKPFIQRCGKSSNNIFYFLSPKNLFIKNKSFPLQGIIYFLIFIYMNIYVGNLNYRIREDDLKSIMEQYGTVDSVKVIKDRETGRSKGFAFVEMQDDKEAKKAINELNEKELEGRQMVVKEAIPKK